MMENNKPDITEWIERHSLLSAIISGIILWWLYSIEIKNLAFLLKMLWFLAITLFTVLFLCTAVPVVFFLIMILIVVVIAPGIKIIKSNIILSWMALIILLFAVVYFWSDLWNIVHGILDFFSAGSCPPDDMWCNVRGP